MILSYKVRLYPTKEQEQLMWKHIGCCRFIWNYMLGLQQELYKNGEKHLSGFDMINRLKPLKNDGEHDWLYEVANKSLQTVCRDLDKAYKEFFKKTRGFPKFKSRKKSKASFPVRSENFYFKNERLLNVEKIGKVRYKTDFEFPFGTHSAKFTNPRISNVNGKWILSFGMTVENQERELTDKTMGIDLGIKETATVAFGEEELKFHNINKSKRVRNIKKRIKHMQRTVSRKYEHSKKKTGTYTKTRNIEKEEAKLRNLHARLANIRQNYTHQTTHKLVAMLPKAVVMEDLSVSGMMKNRHLSKAIQEQNFYEFMRQMKYKCEFYGIECIQVGRFYPSSKTCSCCGCIKSDLKLKDRTFVCPECGAVIDRDYNAAVNLMKYAV